MNTVDAGLGVLVLAASLNRDYDKEVRKGSAPCIGEKAWCTSGR